MNAKQLTPAEVGELMVYISAGDNRKVTVESVTAFGMALEPMAYLDARNAVTEHRRTSTEWLMPAHVNQLARAMRTARTQSAPTAQPPSELNDAESVRWTRARIAAIGDGLTVEQAEEKADALLGVERKQITAKPDPDRIRAIIASVTRNTRRRDVA